MRRAIIVLLMLLLSTGYALAQFSPCSIGINGFCGSAISSGPQPTGDILLIDGTSFILQTDASSLICRAGGC